MLCLRTGTISASFQDKGNRPSRKEVFMISVMGGAKRSAFSFRSHPGIPPGPCALTGLIEHNFLKIENSDSDEKSSFIVLLEDSKASPLYGLWVIRNMTLKPGFRYANHIDICIHNNTVHFVNFRGQGHDIRKEKRRNKLQGRSCFGSRYFRSHSLTFNRDQIKVRLPGQSSRTRCLSKII